MSWKATAFVKELRDGLSITEKFVLLILADYHRTDGKNEWPSMATLASDCLMTERGVQQVIARLDGSFIRREIGGGRGNNNAYKFIGLDIAKGEQETPNGCAVNGHSVNETPHSRAENPAQPSDKPRTAVPRNKVLQDLPVKEPNGEQELPQIILADLHGLQCAHALIGRMHAANYELQGSPALMRSIAGSHEALVATGKSREAAFEFLVAVTLDAIEHGQRVDKFFFEDAKWRGNGSGQQNSNTAGVRAAGQSRGERSLRSISVARTINAARAGDAPNAVKREGQR